MSAHSPVSKSKVFELKKSIGFEAAHFLEGPHTNPDYRNIHGHSFVLEITLKGAVNSDTNWLADFGDISGILADVKTHLDHKLLNDIAGLEKPTLENLCAWITDYLLPQLPLLHQVTVARPSLGESCSLILEV